MVVPSGKKVELVSLVMEADCRDEKGFTNIINNDEQGEGERVEKEDSGLSAEAEIEEELEGSLRVEVASHANVGDQEGDSVQNSPLPPEVPLLHEVLRIPPGQSVPLAQPEEEEEEELCDDGEALLLKAETGPELPGDVIVSKEMLETCGPDLLESRKAKLVFGPEESQCDSKEMVNNSDEGEEEEEEEDLILSSNFVDTISEKSREEEVSSFLPPLTMTTPLKSWEVPRPLVTSTPATGAGECRLSLPPSSSSPLPPPSPDGPLSLPGLVSPGGPKSYDYLLKVLLVGDSDVGKQEILGGLEDGAVEAPYASSTGAAYKTTTILIDGKRVKLQLWDTSGQGRFCTIIRSYSRGAQGILLVYDITNKWSFEGMDRWVKEVEEHAPGIPKVLVGNRLHLAFNRQVEQEDAERYAERHHMGFYEVSPLVNFNITESFQELCRMALRRNGMERLWRGRQVTSLHELCCHAIVGNTSNVYGIDKLPLPDSIKANLKSYALNNATNTTVRPNYKSLKEAKRKKEKTRPADAVASKCVSVSRKSCVLS